jgi:hypothetical protein
VDTEFDMVIVPADGISMSGSDSEDSDWSVGWFEPHHADFAAENDQLENNSFAVLVPCYGSPSRCQLQREEPNPAWTAILANLSRQTSQGLEPYKKTLSTYQKIMTHLCLHSVRWNGQVPPIMLGTWHQASLL